MGSSSSSWWVQPTTWVKKRRAVRPGSGPSVAGAGGRLDELDEHAAGVLGVDEVDPRAGGAAAGLVVQQPHAAIAQDGADLVDVRDAVGELLQARPGTVEE